MKRIRKLNNLPSLTLKIKKVKLRHHKYYCKKHKIKHLLKSLVYGKLFMQVKKELIQTGNNIQIDLKVVKLNLTNKSDSSISGIFYLIYL